jgi:hypothetical protein
MHRILLGLVLVLVPSRGQADESDTATLDLTLAPGSSVTLEGDSTLHRWSSKSSDVRVAASAELPAGHEPQIDGLMERGRLVRMDVTVPVASLKSGNSGLDANMYEALREEEHPSISFHLKNCHAEPNPASAGTYRVTATGNLTVAGSTRPVAIAGIALSRNGVLRVQGGTEILMTDFGIAPPTFLLGAMRTDNKVLIRLNVLLKLGTGTKLTRIERNP